MIIRRPKGDVSVSMRVIGKAKVTFGNLGTMSALQDLSDSTSLYTRRYDDGTVALDARRTGSGVPLPNDGRTNTWAFVDPAQVVDDEYGIAFHAYSTTPDGSTVDAESESAPGMEVNFSQIFGGFGGKATDQARRFTWGGSAGFSLTSINAKASATTTADLVTLTDVYSLDGATPPEAPYSAPSTTTVTSRDANGNEVSLTIDNTTLLANLPYRHETTVTPSGAEIDGFWQVRGAYFGMRVGPWLRWTMNRHFSVRAAAGVTYTYAGLNARYDELVTSLELEIPLRAMNRTTQATKFDLYGAYATLDAEVWLTESTALFVGAAYESMNRKVQMVLDERTADVEFSSSTGFRIGITKLF